jgi:arylsulfatase A-like enzyme
MNFIMNISLKNSIIISTALFSACGTFSENKEQSSSVSKNIQEPNIILFYVDDLGWKDVGYMGSDFYETPNIDKIASNGIIFTNAYSNAPNCAPSRACLMSGQYSPRHGIYTVGESARGASNIRKLIPTTNNETLDTAIVTIAEALRSKGYQSIHLGKWHLGDSTTVKRQGFDYNIGGYKSGGPYLGGKGGWGGYYGPLEYPNLHVKDTNVYLTDELTKRAVSFIHENKNKPFFMYFAHYAVHTPIEGRKDLMKKYAAKEKGNLHNHVEYAAMVESVDLSMEKILETLNKLNLKENTMIVFYSDNGGVPRFTSMYPLRGLKGTIYEGGIRIPMAISWPAVIKPGQKTDVPVIGTDLYPTFLEATGCETPNQPLDGISLMPLLKGKKKIDREALYWHFPAYLQSGGDWKGNMRIRPCSAIRLDNYKLVEYFENGKLELYDLENDIGETNNLVDSLPQKADELYKLLTKWRQDIEAPVPATLNPEFDLDVFNELESKFGDDLIIKDYKL